MLSNKNYQAKQIFNSCQFAWT